MQFSYFGYGSLVNSETLPEGAQVVPGSLKGWVREWSACATWREGEGKPGKGVCALNVRPNDRYEIRGALVLDHQRNLPRLDEREWHYDRKDLQQQAFTPDSGQLLPQNSYIYEVKHEYCSLGNEEHPILLSYVDCVLAGFNRIWGLSGMKHFMETTLGWDTVPILNDRSAPIYPRSVQLEGALKFQIDSLLERENAIFL